MPSFMIIGLLVLQEKIFEGFTIYGHGDHLGHVPGAIAQSVAMSLGNQETLASGTSFREDLVMKIFLWP